LTQLVGGRHNVLWRNDNGAVTDWLSQANGGFVSNFVNAYYEVATARRRSMRMPLMLRSWEPIKVANFD
jgi:hypothetical protein